MKTKLVILCMIIIVHQCNKLYGDNIDSLKTAAQKSSPKEKCITLNRLCLSYFYLNSDSAIKYGQAALAIASKIDFKIEQAHILNNLGNVYTEKGEFTKALNNYFEAEKLFTNVNNNEGRAITSLNIGRVYDKQDFIAQALNQIGILFYRKDKNKSVEYLTSALEINKEINNESRVMEGLNNLGVINQELGKFNEALKAFEVILNFSRSANDKINFVAALHNIGLVYKDQKNFASAISYIDSSIYIAREIKDFADLHEAYSTLSEIYSEKKNHQKALECFRLSSAAKDSFLQQTREKEFAEMSTKYETEKKEKENITLRKQHEIELAVAAEKEKKLNVITYAIAFGLIIVLLFSFILSSRLKITRQQKRIIESQKQVVDEKQKEILDSIHYAQRIQNAILAKEEDIKKYFPESFLFYKPKDIVAGDFYFFDTTETHVFYAAADCTGHGVPGALVSVVCANALSRCVKEFELCEPGKILDKARELVLDTFKKSGQDVKDGMDISLFVKEIKTGQYKWAGANNPLWILKNKNGSTELNQITANKQPIGLSENPQPFTTHDLNLSKGDSVFLFTDGLPDQFGGPKNKKYKYKRLQEKLTESNSLGLAEQKMFIENDLRLWQGGDEQVDDILLIGFRV
jgi:serine phosphatase RsbU (regulator of sigma subunit)